MKTVVVNIRQKFRGAIYIGRPGKGKDGQFGNAHNVGNCAKCGEWHLRHEAIDAFKIDFLKRVETDSVFRQEVLKLRGQQLECFCSPHTCHGDVYVWWLEEIVPDERVKAASPADDFHAHLDVCSQCAEHPFALCSVGAELIQKARA